ncbi:MAG: toxin-antitoxin system HicB family antitoxin [Candidatus Tectomicrobia bacterium]|nr:toxin-antitoxin system HicB family antitoxin [Candidatus Tectomicrobia bacterium]
MKHLTVRLPESLYARLKTIATAEGVSLNQYVLYALSTAVSQGEAEQRFRQLLSQATEADFQEVGRLLRRRIPSRPPEPGDDL